MAGRRRPADALPGALRVARLGLALAWVALVALVTFYTGLLLGLLLR